MASSTRSVNEPAPSARLSSRHRWSMLYRTGRDFFSRHPRLMAGPIGAAARLVPLSIRHGASYRRTRRYNRGRGDDE